MSHISLENKKIISLDSIDNRLVTINNSLDEQSTRLNDQTLETKKLLHQLRINNMYKAHENDLIIDENIFENDEID
jgi:hypothetical protein|tara:strand:- start:838 stop:1065 length:228 start_codon:yes stop_codon:yes gene_type:complete